MTSPITHEYSLEKWDWKINNGMIEFTEKKKCVDEKPMPFDDDEDGEWDCKECDNRCHPGSSHPPYLCDKCGVKVGCGYNPDCERVCYDCADAEYNRRCEAGQAECAVCSTWREALKMNYDDDTGFHTCVSC